MQNTMINSRKALGPKNGSVFGVAGQEKEAVNGGSPAANGAGKSPKRPEVEEELGVQYATMDELLAQSDTVIVIVSTTDLIIDGEALRKMKPTASLVNVARGPTVDTEALTAALQSGEIASAGLDGPSPSPRFSTWAQTAL